MPNVPANMSFSLIFDSPHYLSVCSYQGYRVNKRLSPIMQRRVVGVERVANIFGLFFRYQGWVRSIQKDVERR